MAALPDAPAAELVDLWQMRVEDLEAALNEEIRTWRGLLEWDFRASADLVRRFVDVHALSGYALLAGDQPVGYSYFVCEEHKGLIGDLFVRANWRTAENESLLLGAMVERLMRTRHVRRIESQLMLAHPQRALPAARYARSFPRNFMTVDCAAAARLPARRPEGVVFDHWNERRQDETATLIASAYRGHVDSEINDQYRSAGGARRFLFNIVQYPGCGSFYAPGAWVALHRDTGRLCGVSLTSLVSEHSGHITQICVAPSAMGKGIGYELLRRSVHSLAQAGARKVSLTVTASNEHAVRLYERVGFRTLRQFPALVWEGF